MHAEDFIKKQQKYTRSACPGMVSRQYKNARFGRALRGWLIAEVMVEKFRRSCDRAARAAAFRGCRD
ncbi:hypothetical protein ACCT30_24270, partial [Rhizobium ruizarguesonis]